MTYQWHIHMGKNSTAMADKMAKKYQCMIPGTRYESTCRLLHSLAMTASSMSLTLRSLSSSSKTMPARPSMTPLLAPPLEAPATQPRNQGRNPIHASPLRRGRGGAIGKPRSPAHGKKQSTSPARRIEKAGHIYRRRRREDRIPCVTRAIR